MKVNLSARTRVNLGANKSELVFTTSEQRLM